MQDKIFSFLILIIFSEQYDHEAAERTEPRGDGRGDAIFPCGTEWIGPRPAWLHGLRLPQHTARYNQRCGEMGREQVQRWGELGFCHCEVKRGTWINRLRDNAV